MVNIWTRTDALKYLGYDKLFFLDMQNNGFTLEEVAQKLSTETLTEITLFMVKDIYSNYGIKGRAKSKPKRSSFRTLSKSDLEQVSQETILKLKTINDEYITNPMQSLDNVAEEVSELLHLQVDRKSVRMLFDYFNFKKRNLDMINRSKHEVSKAGFEEYNQYRHNEFIMNVQAAGYSPASVVEAYTSGEAVVNLAKKLNTTPYLLQAFLTKNEIKIRRQRNWKDLIKDLEAKDIGRDYLEKIYITENWPTTKVRDHLAELIGASVGEKSFKRIMEHYSLKKTPENIKALQGAKSKGE